MKKTPKLPNKENENLTSKDGCVKYKTCETQGFMQVKNTGWICPKCGAVMSPTTVSCINCKGTPHTNITTFMTDGTIAHPLPNHFKESSVSIMEL